MNVMRLATSCALACGLAPSAHAVTTPVTFVGGGFFTAETSSCASSGAYVGQGFTVIYRPDTATIPASLVLQYQIGATDITAAAGTSLNGKTTFNSTGISDKAFTYSSSGNSSLKITTAANGLSVTITGTLKNLYGDSTCTLTIQVAATQRP